MAKGKYPEEITVTVLNWQKNNPRKDVKRAIWFKVYNDIFEDIKIRKLSSQQLVTYLWALSRCSIQGVDTFTTDTRQASHTSLHRNIPQFLRSLDALARYGLCTLDKDKEKIKTKTFRETKQEGDEKNEETTESLTCGEPLPLVAESKNSLQKTEKQKPAGEEKKKRVTPDKPAFDFEALYQKYPRKRGKTRGMKIAERDIRTQKEYDNLSLAIDKYCQVIKKEKTDQKYIQLFSTFMNNWLDWLDDGTVQIFDSFEFISAEQFQINQIESLPKSE